MKIGVDVRALQGYDRFRGIGVYLANLIAALGQIDRHNEYVFFMWPADDPLKSLGLPQGFRHQTVLLRTPLHSAVLDSLRNRFARDIRLGSAAVDVFFQPNPAYGLPRGPMPCVTVAYDLVPLIFHNHFFPTPTRGLIRQTGVRFAMSTLLRGWLYHWQLGQLAAASRIIAISHSTAEDLFTHLPSASGKVRIIHPACDPRFEPVADPSETLRKLVIRRPFLMYVGGLDFRKNVGALVTAYERVRRARHHAQLVLVGWEFTREGTPEFVPLWTTIARSPYRDDILRPGFVPVDDLAALYTAAEALVFPSLYEGFGMPVLEAMACGCPVVAYRTSSIPEVAGDAALLLDPGADLAEALVRMLTDIELRTALKAKGRERAQMFSWAETARGVLQVLEEAADQL